MQKSNLLQDMRKGKSLSVMGVIIVLAVMLVLLLVSMNNSYQAPLAFSPDVYFEGEYRIGDGDWKTIEKGQHIPATKGDVTLKGQFHMLAPDDSTYLGLAEPGIPLAFYTNHIFLTVEEAGQPPYIMDVESDYAGEGMCGELCTAYELMTAEPITLTFRNPHTFGNERAIDDFLQGLAIYAGTIYEKNFMAQGEAARYMGLALVIAAFVLLGTALFSALLHVETTINLWLIGLSVLFAGGYFAYSSKGVFFWSDSVIGNTTILGCCMMLYMLCVCIMIVSTLGPKLRKIGAAGAIALGIACVVLTVLSLVTDLRFYNTWLWWVVIQSVINAILLVCLGLGIPGATKSQKTVKIGAAVLLIGFEIDVAGTTFGWWQGGLISRGTFLVLFAISVVLVWQIIPKNINAARRAKEMEAEQKAIQAQLQENRIAIMISQIQPHFIYNTLGTIQQLCKEDPEQAANLVHNFSVYLRGNFSELDSTVPIRFPKELEHVRCYTGIELIRFPDMTVNYDIQTEDFLLPALTVQPLVENAIKHGLMGREEGGTVTVTTFETPTHYCVRVVDDGVGFDETDPQDARKHIGIRNVRERLQVMCGGTLTVESQKGIGTTALIQIPKEGKKV